MTEHLLERWCLHLQVQPAANYPFRANGRNDDRRAILNRTAMLETVRHQGKRFSSFLSIAELPYLGNKRQSFRDFRQLLGDLKILIGDNQAEPNAALNQVF